MAPAGPISAAQDAVSNAGSALKRVAENNTSAPHAIPPAGGGTMTEVMGGSAAEQQAKADLAAPGFAPSAAAPARGGVHPHARELQLFIEAMQRLFQARTPAEHAVALEAFEDDFVLEQNIIYVPGKARVQALAPVIKSLLGGITLAPKFVTVTRSGPSAVVAGGTQGAKEQEAGVKAEVEATLHIRPWRTLLLPATYLLPREVAVEVTIEISADSWSSKISRIKGRAHNLPVVPLPLRYLWGLGAGTSAQIVQPITVTLLSH